MTDEEIEAKLRECAAAGYAERPCWLDHAADAIAAKIRHRDAFMKENRDICQALAPVLGYPRYCDDQKNFPGTTEADGYFDGEGLGIVLVWEAVEKITALKEELRLTEKARAAASAFANALWPYARGHGGGEPQVQRRLGEHNEAFKRLADHLETRKK